MLEPPILRTGRRLRHRISINWLALPSQPASPSRQRAPARAGSFFDPSLPSTAAVLLTYDTPMIEDVVVCFPAGRAGYQAARIHYFALRCEVTMALLQNSFQYYSRGG